jgi:hypothetical protein
MVEQILLSMGCRQENTSMHAARLKLGFKIETKSPIRKQMTQEYIFLGVN